MRRHCTARSWRALRTRALGVSRFLFLVLGASLLLHCEVRAQEASRSPSPGQTRKVLGIDFVWVPPGTFQMGSPHTEKGRQVCYESERLHGVRVPHGFWLGKYEVTQRQWIDLMGKNPSKHDNGDPQRPVERVSWQDCQEFLARLNARTSGEFRLPTEAEWEYACRAGTQTTYCFGNDHLKLGEYAWHYGNAGRTTHPVGQKKPNAWGLYDMHGNVQEWCLDWYKDDYSGGFGEAPPKWCYGRVRRGGSRGTYFGGCRSANRTKQHPYQADSGVGFRILAQSLPDAPEEVLQLASTRPMPIPRLTPESPQTQEETAPTIQTPSATTEHPAAPIVPAKPALPQHASTTPSPSPRPCQLHAAAFAGDLGLVRRLVRDGADINAPDEANRTPLHIAAMRGSIRIVKYLLEHGADPDRADNTLIDGSVEHLTPLDWAESLGHREVADMLRASTAGKSE